MRQRAPRNRTLSCTDDEIAQLSRHAMQITAPVAPHDIEGRLVEGDIFTVAQHLPAQFVDLLILDPPYNLSKNYHGQIFNRRTMVDYQHWFGKMIDLILPTLKSNSTIYICSDWRTSTIILPVLESSFQIQNRITWEREKGRGAKMNWKNNTEDIWFCTMSNQYYFDVDSVKIKRRVLASYKVNGNPKDWQQERNGNYRTTFPSNIWTDITVPFWSMPENTDHPTQKPEKLVAKLILASSQEGGFVFDPFVGSGTTPVVAEKLHRRWSGIDINMKYLCWAFERLALATKNPVIQGYGDGIFWERNSGPVRETDTLSEQQSELFQ